jgi:hypothetical protein
MVFGARRPRHQRSALAGDAIEAFAVGAAARDRPQRVAQVLFHQWDLGLHGERDVGQRLASVSVGGDSGQHPRRALLHHQAARAVDRVDNDDDLDVLLARAGGQHAAPVLAEPFGHEQARPPLCELLEAREQHRLRQAIDGEHSIARIIAHDRRQLVYRLALTRRDHLVADGLVHAADVGDQRLGVTQAGHVRL